MTWKPEALRLGSRTNHLTLDPHLDLPHLNPQAPATGVSGVFPVCLEPPAAKLFPDVRLGLTQEVAFHQICPQAEVARYGPPEWWDTGQGSRGSKKESVKTGYVESIELQDSKWRCGLALPSGVEARGGWYCSEFCPLCPGMATSPTFPNPRA